MNPDKERTDKITEEKLRIARHQAAKDIIKLASNDVSDIEPTLENAIGPGNILRCSRAEFKKIEHNEFGASNVEDLAKMKLNGEDDSVIQFRFKTNMGWFYFDNQRMPMLYQIEVYKYKKDVKRVAKRSPELNSLLQRGKKKWK